MGKSCIGAPENNNEEKVKNSALRAPQMRTNRREDLTGPRGNTTKREKICKIFDDRCPENKRIIG